jgi:FdrA protein
VNTKVIVVISKPPAPKTKAKVLAALRKVRKPVVVNFLGAGSEKGTRRQAFVRTLEEAASRAVGFAGGGAGPVVARDHSEVAFAEASKLAGSQQYVRGLYSGGTLCYEAEVVMAPMLGPVYSNAPLDKKLKVAGPAKSKKHTCVDMGAEEYVVGRAHPMIDFTLRKMRILEEARDPGTAVILLDVELGLGSNPDPAGELVPAITEAKVVAEKAGRYLSVVAHVLGTDGDFQGLARQEKALEDAGVVLVGSNAAAARLAALIATRGKAPGNMVR